SSPDMIRYVRTAAGRAAATARETPGGPVHLNFPFRDPLIPHPASADWIHGRGIGTPYVKVSYGAREPDSAVVEELAVELGGIERGLIVCGPQNDARLPEAIV